MSQAQRLIERMAPAMARKAVSGVVEHMFIGRAPAGAGVSDLLSLHPDERSLDKLVDAITPSLVGRKEPWYRSAELGAILGQPVEAVARNHPLPQHRQFVKTIQVKDFKPTQILVGLDGMAQPQLTNERGEYVDVNLPDIDLETGSPARYGSIVRITEERLRNGMLEACGFLSQTPKALVASAYRLEATKVYALLNSGATMKDGQAWINTTNSVSAANAATALSDGLVKLMGQSFGSGELVDQTPRVLVLPTSWLTAAQAFLETLRDIGISITVVLSSRSTYGWWFCSPELAPAIGLLTLSEQAQPSVSAQQVHMRGATDIKLPERITGNIDLKVEHIFGIVPISRQGFVRMAVA